MPQPENVLRVGPAPPRRDEITGSCRQDRIGGMSRVTNAGGHAISGQRIRHRGSLANHEPVVPAYSRCHVGLKRHALDLEDRVRSEQGVKPLVAQQLVAQNRLDGAAGSTPAADDVGREHDADAGLTRGDRNVPHPAQIAVAVVHEECRSVIERRRVRSRSTDTLSAGRTRW